LCLSSFDVHVAIDSGSRVRVGPTETLNSGQAVTEVFPFHGANGPFHLTSVLTTYSKYSTSSPGCSISTQYDTKIAPVNGYHTGAATITTNGACENACIDIEFLNSEYNAAGKCRFKFDAACAP